MIALTARGIRKSFGRRQVLTGLDLEVAAGEMVAVVGENGTGKTTLLRILAGDLRPDAGTVAIGGRPGYCPQTVVLDEALTVDQNVRYFQAAYGIGRTGRAGVNVSTTVPEDNPLDTEDRGIHPLIRFSPHYCNTEDEIDRATELVAAMAR